MKRLSLAVLSAWACACSRPPAANNEQAGGLTLHHVTFEAWRDGKVTVKGHAPQVSLGTAGFEALDVTLELASGSRVDAPTLTGDPDGLFVNAPSGGIALTKEGCVAKTKSASHSDGSNVRISGDVALGGCGIALNAKGLTYAVAAHQAEIDGPVQTHLEAQKP